MLFHRNCLFDLCSCCLFLDLLCFWLFRRFFLWLHFDLNFLRCVPACFLCLLLSDRFITFDNVSQFLMLFLSVRLRRVCALNHLLARVVFEEACEVSTATARVFQYRVSKFLHYLEHTQCPGPFLFLIVFQDLLTFFVINGCPLRRLKFKLHPTRLDELPEVDLL